MPEKLVLSMSQHLGAPCIPAVSRGDRVERGQLVGDVEAMISAPVHSPVAGEVAAVLKTRLVTGQTIECVEITPDPEQDWESFEPIPASDDPRKLVRAAGIVGLGGAAFPSHVKLAPPKDLPITTVILNGCECEPFLTCDHRMMLEHAADVIAGARLIRDVVGADRVVIGLEDNKRDAAKMLEARAGDDVEVIVLPTAYPQGAEKQLIWSILGKEVGHGQLPASAGALVHNVGTAVAILRAVEERMPLMERVLTVSGAVVKPANSLVPLGTPIAHILDQCGGLTVDAARLIAGGPMTGHGICNTDAPVVKGTSGILALTEKELAPAVNGDQPCIRCGKCSDACPMMLEPFALGITSNRSDWEGAERYHALDCIECGCCSYVCPTRRPLVQLIRLAKGALLSRGSKL